MTHVNNIVYTDMSAGKGLRGIIIMMTSKKNDIQLDIRFPAHRYVVIIFSFIFVHILHIYMTHTAFLNIASIYIVFNFSILVYTYRIYI